MVAVVVRSLRWIDLLFTFAVRDFGFVSHLIHIHTDLESVKLVVLPSFDFKLVLEVKDHI